MKKKLIKKLSTLPKITRGVPAKNDRYKGFPVEHYSKSSFIQFCTDSHMFNVIYVQKLRFNSTSNISAVIGKAIHKGLEVYYSPKFLRKVYIKDDDGKQVYVLDENNEPLFPMYEMRETVIESAEDAMRFGLESCTQYIEDYQDGFIDYSSTIPTKEKALVKIVFGYNSYIQEKGEWGKQDIVSLEEELIEYIDIVWKGRRVVLPIKLKGFLDKIKRDKDGGLILVDYKTTSIKTDLEKMDGDKMIQAIQYYFLAYAKYGEEPKKFIFEVIKLSKNKNGSPQVTNYVIDYSDMGLMFDFYLRLYDDITRALQGEAVFVPNMHAMFNSDISMLTYIHRLDEPKVLANQMKKYKVENITELLRKKLTRATSMKAFVEKMQKKLREVKTINYSQMKNEEKIVTKLAEFGIMTVSEGKIEGNAVDMYLIALAPSTTVKSVTAKSEDIALLLGVDSVRITRKGVNIGIEVPREERVFPDIKPINEGFNLTMGVNLMGDVVKKDIREFPHLLIGGSTGSGKSVFMDTIVNQLLGINDIDITLIDPKGTEFLYLKDYDNVVSYSADIEKTESILKNAVVSMNARFEILSKLKAKDISMYNKSAENKMKYRFIIIDEFGDLIAQNHKVKREKRKTSIRVGVNVTSETENITEYELNISQEIMKHIQLLSQKARAVGIHLVLATQRPSTDVVTGSIKNNFPCKAVFKMSKAVDSQVIMDDAGAEKLLGKGDFLLVSNEGTERLQGLMI